MLMLFLQPLLGRTRQTSQEVQSLRKVSGLDKWLMLFQEDIRESVERALQIVFIYCIRLFVYVQGTVHSLLAVPVLAKS